MGGNASICWKDQNYGIDFNATGGITIGGALAAQKLGSHTSKTSDTAGSFM